MSLVFLAALEILHPSVANLHDDVRNRYIECGPRGTPDSVPCIHVNWPFPTPIITPVTSLSFPTDPCSFLCA